ncbi:MAG: DNA internalization-related competence protein ComEC/Rec2 [Firmicutes bacterium]|nr:DNA internalization-related competence protein ComEC/Rec2 [Bacillota bacterium]
MRRPVLFFMAALAGGILFQFYVDAGWLFFSALGATVIFSCSRKSRLWILLLAFLLGGLSFACADLPKSGLLPYEGKTAVLTGTILSVQEGEGSLTFVVDAGTCIVGGKTLSLQEKILVRSYGSDTGDLPGNAQWLVGKKGEFRGTLAQPAGRRNPNLFDYQLYLKSQGILMTLTAGSFAVEEEVSAPVLHGLAVIRGTFIRQLFSVLPRDDGGLLVGMLFGDRSFLSEEIYALFQKNGTAHILAVSGIHVGTVYLFFQRLTGGSRRLSLRILSLGFLWFYAALAAFSPSVVRAAVMITIHILGKVLLRRYDLLCGTAAAAVLMLLWNPFYLFEAGFQLSFMAVFSLAFLLPYTDSLTAKCRRIFTGWPAPLGTIAFRLLDSLAPLLAIQAGMIPIMAFHFLTVSAGAFFANPPTLFLAGILIPLGIVMIPLAFVGGPFFGIAATCAGFLSRGMIFLNDWIFVPWLSVFQIQAPSRWLLVLYYGLLFFFASEFRRLRGVRMLPLLLAGLLAIGFLFSFAAGQWQGRAELQFIDVGQGDCLLIRSPSGAVVTIDGGGSQTYDVGTEILMPYMRKNGIRKIDLALVTHLHDDHYLGISSLAEQFPIERMITELEAGDRVVVDDEVWIDILYPEEGIPRDGEAKYEDENETCLLMKVYCNGVTVLMTGDMGFEQEDAVLKLYEKTPEVLKSDILKVGHHGSKYSTSQAFLDAVDPSAAVIQVGKNNFGHPHEDVIEKLRENGIMVYRNDLDGAVLVDVKNGEFQVKTMLRDKS